MPRLADPALPERRRAQILQAARACFRERGFRDATIEEICAEARMSPGALYRYFGSKADIVAAIAIEARAEAEAELDRLASHDGLIDGLARMARTFFEAFDNDADAALFADIWAEAARDPVLAKTLRERDQAARARLAAVIGDALSAGVAYPALDPPDAADVLLAALEGYALRRALSERTDLAEDVRRYRALTLQLLKPKR